MPNNKDGLLPLSAVACLSNRSSYTLAVGMIVPKTKDGRVVFMLPWLDQTIAGTTDSSTEITMRPQVNRCVLGLVGWRGFPFLPCSNHCTPTVPMLLAHSALRNR